MHTVSADTNSIWNADNFCKNKKIAVIAPLLQPIISKMCKFIAETRANADVDSW